MSLPKTGAENVRWDLSVLFDGPDDPRISERLDALEEGYKSFNAQFKGALTEKLGDALRAYSELSSQGSEVFVFLFLLISTDQANEEAKSVARAAEERISLSSAKYLTFFDHELVELSDENVAAQAAKDTFLAQHMPYVQQARVFKPYLLSEDVEEALAKRAPFGAGAWAEFYDEVEADLETHWDERHVTFTEMLNILSHDQDPAVRARALERVDQMLSGFFHKYSARTLNQIVRSKAVSDAERGYAHPMAARNLSTMIDDDVVEALHDASKTRGAELGRRFYVLKARLLGMKTLKWSDRNAPMPFKDTSVVPFDEATETVIAAYRSFSPTLADIVQSLLDERRVDAPVVKGKQGGAFNYSMMGPDGKPLTWVFLNYMGTNSDVMTFAHEVGHACHGYLAGEAGGALFQHAPMAYAETASVFGEMTTFTYIKAHMEEAGDKNALLALIMEKANDIMNTMLRQISFSEFERRVHDAGRQLSPKELDGIWMHVTKEFYGEDGDVFTYENAERLWSYVGHFHRPFYVYAYACGELLTQSLYARKDDYGEDFERLYLELLRKGGREGIVDLMAPFGLDPKDPEFWTRGIDAALTGLLQEAEALTDELFPEAPTA